MKDTDRAADRFKLNILENCLSFVEEAIQKSMASKNNSRAWKFAIVHIVQAIELSLKELLRREHPALIYDDIDRPKFTVGIETAIQRLKSLKRASLSDKDVTILREAQQIRNEIIHKEVDLSIEQVRVLFSKLVGFLSYFHDSHLERHLVDSLPHELYEFLLQNQNFVGELEIRARQRIEEQGIDDDEVIYCPFCATKTFVLENLVEGTCFVCRLTDHVEECAGCKGRFTTGEMKDLSGHFEYSNEGRLYTLEDDYGYNNHFCCADCLDSIVEDIKEKRRAQEIESLERDYYYRIERKK